MSYVKISKNNANDTNQERKYIVWTGEWSNTDDTNKGIIKVALNKITNVSYYTRAELKFIGNYRNGDEEIINIRVSKSAMNGLNEGTMGYNSGDLILNGLKIEYKITKFSAEVITGIYQVANGMYDSGTIELRPDPSLEMDHCISENSWCVLC